MRTIKTLVSTSKIKTIKQKGHKYLLTNLNFHLMQMGAYLSADNAFTRIIKNATKEGQGIGAALAGLGGLILIAYAGWLIFKHFTSERAQTNWAKVIGALLFGGALTLSGLKILLDFGSNTQDVLDTLNTQVLPLFRLYF